MCGSGDGNRNIDSEKICDCKLLNRRQRLWYSEVTSRWSSKYKFFGFGHINLKFVGLMTTAAHVEILLLEKLNYTEEQLK